MVGGSCVVVVPTPPRAGVRPRRQNSIMSGNGKRKPAAVPAGKRTSKRPADPEPESDSGESADEIDSEVEDGESGSGESSEDDRGEGGQIAGSDDDSMSEDASDDDDEEASSSLDELDDDEFGDVLDDDEIDDHESDGAGDDESDDEYLDDDDEDETDDEDTEPSRKRDRDAAASSAAARAEGGGAAAFGFARAFANLVGDKSRKDGSEILPKTKKQKKVEVERKLEKKARSLEKRNKLELRERGHVVPKNGAVDPVADQLERKMLQTATRGVVRLFNAVSKAQKTVADAAGKRKGLVGKTVKELTKGSFLQELKKTSGDRVKDTSAKDSENEKTETENAGWDVLADGYLMGRNKLKDWDKGTKKAEEDVEYEDDDFD